MYCGSCLRDNALATELIARGHDVTLLPVYTPTLTDEENVSHDKVFFGGVSVYLEQYVPVFRNSPKVAGSRLGFKANVGSRDASFDLNESKDAR
jgi:hypothetical protein